MEPELDSFSGSMIQVMLIYLVFFVEGSLTQVKRKVSLTLVKGTQRWDSCSSCPLQTLILNFSHVNPNLDRRIELRKMWRL